VAQLPPKAELDRLLDRETIAAVATPPGRGAVGIVRISGPRAAEILNSVCGRPISDRRPTLATFSDNSGQPIDQGLALLFRSPHSFTGEDVGELQGHGGPIVTDLLLQAALVLGARMARPGEFTERAFRNGKLDLAQAEAVADLIASGSTAAARSALRSLSGHFSDQISVLANEMLLLRVFVEGAIDFPEEEVDFVGEGRVQARLERLIGEVAALLRTATQGQILNDGITLVLAGRPNAGKSSLLNKLLGYERAIVSSSPGTTRDVLAERMNLDGIPVRIVDTAGLRATLEPVEQEGVRRAETQVAEADRVLLIRDDADAENLDEIIAEHALPTDRLTVVSNKIDLSHGIAGHRPNGRFEEIGISALTGVGLDELKDQIKRAIGFHEHEGVFSARRRHLDALERARSALQHGADALASTGAAELLAEDLRLAHTCLGEIVGTVSSDALLGEIFSRFCIGK
jgi:tRNA modification GTPase